MAGLADAGAGRPFERQSTCLDDAEAMVLPAVADLVQEALEQGFDGRAYPSSLPSPPNDDRMRVWRGVLRGVAAGAIIWAVVIQIVVLAMRSI